MCDVDFEIIQRAHIEIINTPYTKVIRSLFLLKNVQSQVYRNVLNYLKKITSFQIANY